MKEMKYRDTNIDSDLIIDIEKEKDEDIDIEKEKDKENNIKTKEVTIKKEEMGVEIMSYIVVITSDTLPLNKEPKVQSEIVEMLKKEQAFTIVKEYKDTKNEIWGQIKSQSGWIELKHTKRYDD